MSAFDYEEQCKEKVKVFKDLSNNNFVYKKVTNLIGTKPDAATNYYYKDGTEYRLYQMVDPNGSNYLSPEGFDVRKEYYTRHKEPFLYEEKTKFENIASNFKYVRGFAQHLYTGSYGEIINKHVFKFTKLRDEIIFINGNLRKPGDSNIGKSICIAVNEKSFWNRLNFYKNPNTTSTFKQTDDLDPFDLILGAMRRSNEISNVTLRILPNEETALQGLVDGLDDTDFRRKTIIESNITNNANFEISGYESHSKRLWLAYFNYLKSNNGLPPTEAQLFDDSILNYTDKPTEQSNGGYSYYLNDKNFNYFDTYSLFYQIQIN